MPWCRPTARRKTNEAYAYEVLSEALDSGRGRASLSRALSKSRGLASGVDTNYDPDARGDAIFTIALTPAPGKNVTQLQKALTEELQKLAQQGIDEATVAAAQARAFNASAIFARDSLMMPGYVFGMALTTGHAVNDVEDWPDRIAAVTADDVNTALQGLVNDPRTMTAALLPDHRAAARRGGGAPVIRHDMGIR